VIGRAFASVGHQGRWRILPIPSTFTRLAVSQPRAAAAALGARIEARGNRYCPWLQDAEGAPEVAPAPGEVGAWPGVRARPRRSRR